MQTHQHTRTQVKHTHTHTHTGNGNNQQQQQQQQQQGQHQQWKQREMAEAWKDLGQFDTILVCPVIECRLTVSKGSDGGGGKGGKYFGKLYRNYAELIVRNYMFKDI